MAKDEKGRYEEIVATFLHYNNQWSDIYEKILCYIKQLKAQSSKLFVLRSTSVSAIRTMLLLRRD